MPCGIDFVVKKKTEKEIKRVRVKEKIYAGRHLRVLERSKVDVEI